MTLVWATQRNAVQWPYDTGMGNTGKCCGMAL